MKEVIIMELIMPLERSISKESLDVGWIFIHPCMFLLGQWGLKQRNILRKTARFAHAYAHHYTHLIASCQRGKKKKRIKKYITL
jgi:hypothetical protein